METHVDYVKIQRKLLELVQGIVNESKELSYEMSSRHMAVTPVRNYVTDLVKAVGLDEQGVKVNIRETWLGEIVDFTFEDELCYSVLKSEAVRAQTYAKLINLGTGLMDVPDHLYTDHGVLAYLNDLAALMEVSPKTNFTDSELDASIESYEWWGSDTPLIEHIRRAATAYLPGNGFQRESMLTRAFLAYAMLVKQEKSENDANKNSEDIG